MKLSEIKPNPNNPRVIKDYQFEKLCKSIQEFPKMMELRPIIVDDNNTVLGGNMRLRALQKLGYKDIPDTWVKKASELTEEEKRRFVIADNVNAGEWDWDTLANEWDANELEDWGIDIPNWDAVTKDYNNLQIIDKVKSIKLSERFIIPPMSILDTKQGVWENRKKMWLDIGIKSEEGRRDDLVRSGLSKLKRYNEKTEIKGTSIFDPVLCEIIYRWFCVDDGIILDPFAGGSVRGIVASVLGYKYYGIDIRKEQIDANINNAKQIINEELKMPNWILGNSKYLDSLIDINCDLLFSCPPYHDLEVYSDIDGDISNMDYDKFLEDYNDIINKSCHKLKENRFAVFVVGEIRNNKGNYKNFVSHTIDSFLSCGLSYYNEIILANKIGAMALVAGKYFNSSRKITKVHQNVLVFYKGDVKKIKDNFKELNFADKEI